MALTSKWINKSMPMIKSLLPRAKDTGTTGLVRSFSVSSTRARVNISSKNNEDTNVNKNKILTHATSIQSVRYSHTISDENFLLRQLHEAKSNTYTYLLADAKSKEAVLIDPVVDTVERDLKVINIYGVKVLYGINTHLHADHITGTGELKKHLSGFSSMISAASGAKADFKVQDGQIIKFGRFALEARSTPGHTDGCMSFVCHEKKFVMTGDTLLIGGCGRTDFQQGDPSLLYDSVYTRLYSLGDDFAVFPAHDYNGRMMSTIGEEKQHNRRLNLQKTKSQFVTIMENLNLPNPKQIDVAVPANQMCGVY